MRGILGFGLVTVLVASLLWVGAPVMAEEQVNCEISNTGPGSNNTCETDTDYICTVLNDNQVKITDRQGQEAASGDVEVSGNNAGGDVTSGTVKNSSGQVFDVTINNDGICTASMVTPETPPEEKPTKPVQPEGGKGEQTPVKNLPYTGTDESLRNLSFVAGGVLAIATASVASVLLYRYRRS